MESQKIYLAGAGEGNSGLYSMLASALNNRGIDLASAMAMCGNKGNNGILGGGFQDIIALIIVAAIFGNGDGGIFGNGNKNNGVEKQMLMDAIQRNGIDISQLASSFHCSEAQILSGINSVATQICNLSAQSGQNAANIIAQMQQGNMSLVQQICNCCCDMKQLVTAHGYENQTAILNQTNVLQGAINGVSTGVERGFANLGFAAAQQTCDLKQNADLNTRAILSKLDAIEDSRKDREIAALNAQLASATARAERQSELAPIYKALSDIACKQPSTITLPNPDAVAVPTCVAAQYGLGYPFNNFRAF